MKRVCASETEGEEGMRAIIKVERGTEFYSLLEKLLKGVQK